MAFSWKNCTVLHNRVKEEKSGCYSALARYESCLTPKVKEGLLIWLNRKISKYGTTRVTKESVAEDIAELLTKCCNAKHAELVMRRDVELAETEIIAHIRSAIQSRRIRGIYKESDTEVTKEKMDSMTIVSREYLDRWLREVNSH